MPRKSAKPAEPESVEPEQDKAEQEERKGFSLTPDQAKKILQKDIANLVRKVASGGNLSTSQRNVLLGAVESTPAALDWAKNQVELADALGVDRKTIQRWLKEDGCPQARSDGRYNVSEWTTWAGQTGRKTVDVNSVDEYRKLEIRRLTSICERLDLELAVQKGEYTSNETIAKQIYQMIGSARKVLGAMPAQLAPQVVGMAVADAEQRIREHIDGAMKHLHEHQWD